MLLCADCNEEVEFFPVKLAINAFLRDLFLKQQKLKAKSKRPIPPMAEAIMKSQRLSTVDKINSQNLN